MSDPIAFVVGSLCFWNEDVLMSQIKDTPIVQSEMSLRNGALTLGNFDGFHRGHQSVVKCLVDSARKIGGPAIVLTLYPHPANVLIAPGTVPLLLPLTERIRLLKGAGVDHVEVISFTPELAQLTAEEFAQKSMIGLFKPKTVVAGPDTRFGRGREGDVDLLSKLGKVHGFDISQVDALIGENTKISSSNLRAMISNGEVSRAASWLGRCYTICGEVVKGDGRGKTIGIPTANVLIQDHVEPATGVYAVRVKVAGKTYGGVANYGRRPTFVDEENAATVLEVHLLNVQGLNLYGQTAEVSFVKFIREEARFSTVNELLEQIEKDKSEATYSWR